MVLSQVQPKMTEFPTNDLLPKKETKADSFVEKYPEYNGKDVTIGILDTGVDPGAIGLSLLPDGSRKLIHVADCTGSGDVSMNTQVDAINDERGWVIEKDVFGNELILNGSLNLQPFPKDSGDDVGGEGKKKADESKSDTISETNAVGAATKIRMPVRVAFKRAYELFPKKLTNRVKKHYARAFEEEQHRHAVSVRSKYSGWKEKYRGSAQLSKEQIRERDDYLAKLDVLEGKLPATDPLKEDPGPIYQIILFYDGKDFRTIVHTTNVDNDCESPSDLSTLPVDRAMTDYHKEFQYGTFSHVDMMNYAVNIYQNGKIVSIVVDAGAHGSHVAGIAARYHPSEDNEEANGVACGAKIVALKIGDTRLGSMETGTAMTRAMIEAVKHKCDVINLSYGEGCALPNDGRFVEMADELVNKHGIVFVSSAGNNGPALSTVGAPGGTTDSIISVAAYVSPPMMEAEYSMQPKLMKGDDIVEENTGTTYTWSSVGPTVDGALGVDITAPGAAITCVPNWCLQRSQLMNGTSMSSPNATGCIALLLSAAKAEGIKLTPSRLKCAIRNTAQVMPGLSCLQQGFGMINVERAWEHIKSLKDDPYQDVNFKVRVLNRPGMPRGVYLRQVQEVSAKQSFSVEIDPIFNTSDDVSADTQMKRVEFEMKFILKTDSDFVDVPDFFMLVHNGRSFKFEVDPTQLSTGVHTTKICGFDAANPETGPRFVIPITVVKPIAEKVNLSLGKLEFAPNEVKRFFLEVPAHATWMDVMIKDERSVDVDGETSTRLIVLHTVQLLPHEAYRNAEEQKYFNLRPSQETVTSIPVHAGITCELDLARYWSAQGITKISASVKFRGVTPVPDTVHVFAGNSGGKVRLQSNLGDEYVLPKAKLTKWRSPLSPTNSGIISPCCDERDVVISSNKQIYQLVLKYEFENKEGDSIIPRAPMLQGYLYESGFESQIMLVFDEDRKLLGTADSWPSQIKIPKGKISIFLQIRHDNVKKLDPFKNLTIWIERKLSKEISLLAYKSHKAMVTSGSTWNKSLLRAGTATTVFFAEPSSSVPAECRCGDVLVGSASFAAGSDTLQGAGKRPGGFEVKYIIGSKAKEEKEEKAKTPEVSDERSIDEKIEEAIRSTKLEQLEKLSDKMGDRDAFVELYEKLIQIYPSYLPLRMAGLKFYDNKMDRLNNLPNVIKGANAVIDAIDEVALAQHFGLKHDDENAESCKLRKESGEKRADLVDALARKARAISDLELLNELEELGEIGSFEETLKNLHQWTDASSKKFSVLTLERARREGHYGSMLKLLTTLLETKGSDTKGGFAPMEKDDIVQERKKVLEALEFNHLKKRDFSWNVITKVKDYALF